MIYFIDEPINSPLDDLSLVPLDGNTGLVAAPGSLARGSSGRSFWLMDEPVNSPLDDLALVSLDDDTPPVAAPEGDMQKCVLRGIPLVDKINHNRQEPKSSRGIYFI